MMISVCMPTFNGEKYIKEQLDSILMQLDISDEIIISDDSSTDRTVQIIESINDSRIKLLKNNKFFSPIFNLENALKVAKGDIILLADQDDIWEQNKVNVMINHLKYYDIVVSDCSIIDAKGNEIKSSFFKLLNSRKGFLKNLTINTFLGCCMGFKSDILRYALPFPKKIPMHDIWIGLLGEIFGKTYFVKDKLVKYRRHDNNASFSSTKSEYSLLFKISYRIRTICLIFARVLKVARDN